MLREELAAIAPLDAAAREQCRLRLDNLSKPLGSLQGLEDLAVKLAGVTGQARPRRVAKALMVVTTGCRVPHGGEMLLTALAAHAGATLAVLDAAAVRRDSGRRGLTREQVRRAVEIGWRAARGQLRRGVRAIGLGAMGDLAAAAAMVVDAVRQEHAADPLAVLAATDAPELAVLTGIILAAAAGRAIIVLDGAATAAAALAAVSLTPAARDYLIGSQYTDALQREALDMLAVPAYLRLDMRLDGGVGAAFGLTLLDAALHVLNDMKTFGEAAVAVAQDGPGALRQRADMR